LIPRPRRQPIPRERVRSMSHKRYWWLPADMRSTQVFTSIQAPSNRYDAVS
jgi:hypothetical protein